MGRHAVVASRDVNSIIPAVWDDEASLINLSKINRFLANVLSKLIETQV
jgi:hypothetical protein